jgi:carbonic anhydrase
MASSTHIQSLLSRNAAITTYQPPPHLAQLGELWAANPTIPRTLIISCADPRCHPETIFNLNPSDPADAAVVVRVQGGDVQSALPAVFALDNLINFTHTILLKHTDCGSLVFRDEKIKAQLKERVAGSGVEEEVEAMRFGENTVPMEESVRRDLRWVRESPLLSEGIKKGVTGMLFHLDSGRVEVIE